jgi:putative transposase
MSDKLRKETMFRNLADALIVIAVWAADENTAGRHSALDYQTEVDYARALITAIARPTARNESSERRAISQSMTVGVNSNRALVAVESKVRGRSLRPTNVW